MTPKRVLIVGGGTSGWMAAAYLQGTLGHEAERPVEISLIESPDALCVAGGESTLLNIRTFLAVIGTEEIDFLRQVGGSFRQATKFVDWLRGTGDFYYHPFDRNRAQPIDRAAMQWLRSDRSVAFAETVSPQPIICDLGLAPVPMDDRAPNVPLAYAYHVDTLRFTALLRETAVSGGVKHYVDQVAEVEMAENGDIEAILTESGDQLEADLFIDCTGFAASLIDKRLGVEWIDYSQWLLCDREVVMNVDYEQHYSGHVRPYTTATALSAGWVREIPLQDRKILSYVHSSRYVDVARASQDLRTFEGRHARSLDTQTVNFNAGHRAKPWARNCVSIGRSAGHIEPLEATDLYLDVLSAEMLAEHFPFTDDMRPFAYRFNRIMTNRFYEILDITNMHYCLTRRSDTEFWREVSKPERIHDRLKAKLDFWRSKIPSKSDFVDQRFPGQADMSLQSDDHRSPVDTAALFGYENYETILYGMQFLADECDDWFGSKRPRTQVPRYIIRDLQQAPHSLPPHEVWLKTVAGMPEYPVSSRARQ